ncbi:hypothetical protein M231_04774 [Tremella mesenterica]|uniref:Uncharacterized protein n=1 Tax=Tremella mesenterica TaxID=5217 RepID=A0A4Q1BJS1_TREME|nr:hypothetical protein M231_04774 [Tremella mesenterica]
MLNIRPVVSAPLAGCCTIFSVFGVIILLAFGSFYSHHAEALTASTEDPRDPDSVARTCYAAAVIYAVFVGFCGLQVGHFFSSHLQLFPVIINQKHLLVLLLLHGPGAWCKVWYIWPTERELEYH